MQFTKYSGNNATEKIWLNMFITSHEWHNDLAVNANAGRINYRGMIAKKVLDPTTNTEVSLGCQVTVGNFGGANDYRTAIGVVDTDMIIDKRNVNPGRVSTGQLERLWVLIQVYGHCERIWTVNATRPMATDQYLVASLSNSGCVDPLSAASIEDYQTLVGIFQLTVPVGGGTFLVDLSGTNSAGVAWDWTGSSTRPLVWRDHMGATQAAGWPNITSTASAGVRPKPSQIIMGYHYQENSPDTSGYALNSSTPYDTYGNRHTITRGWLMCMGIGINGA